MDTVLTEVQHGLDCLRGELLLTEEEWKAVHSFLLPHRFRLVPCVLRNNGTFSQYYGDCMFSANAAEHQKGGSSISRRLAYEMQALQQASCAFSGLSARGGKRRRLSKLNSKSRRDSGDICNGLHSSVGSFGNSSTQSSSPNKGTVISGGIGRGMCYRKRGNTGLRHFGDGGRTARHRPQRQASRYVSDNGEISASATADVSAVTPVSQQHDWSNFETAEHTGSVASEDEDHSIVSRSSQGGTVVCGGKGKRIISNSGEHERLRRSSSASIQRQCGFKNHLDKGSWMGWEGDVSMTNRITQEIGDDHTKGVGERKKFLRGKRADVLQRDVLQNEARLECCWGVTGGQTIHYQRTSSTEQRQKRVRTIFDAKFARDTSSCNNKLETSLGCSSLKFLGSSAGLGVDLGMSWRQSCCMILQHLKRHQAARWFLFPVDPEVDGVPGYFDVITRPMCFQVIEQRLLATTPGVQHPMLSSCGGKAKEYKEMYYTHPSQWQQDVRQVFYNAFTYHSNFNEVWRDAAVLATEFERCCRVVEQINPYFPSILKQRWVERENSKNVHSAGAIASECEKGASRQLPAHEIISSQQPSDLAHGAASFPLHMSSFVCANSGTADANCHTIFSGGGSKRRGAEGSISHIQQHQQRSQLAQHDCEYRGLSPHHQADTCSAGAPDSCEGVVCGVYTQTADSTDYATSTSGHRLHFAGTKSQSCSSRQIGIHGGVEGDESGVQRSQRGAGLAGMEDKEQGAAVSSFDSSVDTSKVNVNYFSLSDEYIVDEAPGSHFHLKYYPAAGGSMTGSFKRVSRSGRGRGGRRRIRGGKKTVGCLYTGQQGPQELRECSVWEAIPNMKTSTVKSGLHTEISEQQQQQRYGPDAVISNISAHTQHSAASEKRKVRMTGVESLSGKTPAGGASNLTTMSSIDCGLLMRSSSLAESMHSMDAPVGAPVLPPPPVPRIGVNDKPLSSSQRRTLEQNMQRLSPLQRKAALELIQDDLGILAAEYMNVKAFAFDTELLSIEKQKRLFAYVNSMNRANREILLSQHQQQVIARATSGSGGAADALQVTARSGRRGRRKKAIEGGENGEPQGSRGRNGNGSESSSSSGSDSDSSSSSSSSFSSSTSSSSSTSLESDEDDDSGESGDDTEKRKAGLLDVADASASLDFSALDRAKHLHQSSRGCRIRALDNASAAGRSFHAAVDGIDGPKADQMCRLDGVQGYACTSNSSSIRRPDSYRSVVSDADKNASGFVHKSAASEKYLSLTQEKELQGLQPVQQSGDFTDFFSCKSTKHFNDKTITTTMCDRQQPSEEPGIHSEDAAIPFSPLASESNREDVFFCKQKHSEQSHRDETANDCKMSTFVRTVEAFNCRDHHEMPSSTLSDRRMRNFVERVDLDATHTHASASASSAVTSGDSVRGGGREVIIGQNGSKGAAENVLRPSLAIKNFKNSSHGGRGLPQYTPVCEEGAGLQIREEVMGRHADFFGVLYAREAGTEVENEVASTAEPEAKSTAWQEWKGQVIQQGFVSQRAYAGQQQRRVSEIIAEGFDARI